MSTAQTSSGLNLDARQRAMLLEMGVRVWQPFAFTAPVDVRCVARPDQPGFVPDAATSAPTPIPVQTPTHTTNQPLGATHLIATNTANSSRRAVFDSTSTAPAPAPALLPNPAADGYAASWSIAAARVLYAPTPGPCWLVLASMPAAAIAPQQADTSGTSDSFDSFDSFDPFEGDTGKLFNNILRALRLHQAGTAWLAPLVWQTGAPTAPTAGFYCDLSGAQTRLQALIKTIQPRVVLVMGRLPAQAVLRSNEPFGKLRSCVHTLHGVPTIVTQDTAYLLRHPLEKARAWQDLCLAVSVL